MSSTPTLFNSGTKRPQLSSCYLTTIPDDLDGIFSAMKDNALLSKWAGGLGNDWTPVRAMNSYIKGTNGKSQGVVPFLKVANDTAVAVNQGGKRKGAMCGYLETWHLDIEEFLELRKNTGDERRRTHDMNTANWVPDLFMKRVEQDENWTLFSPGEAPELHDLVGKAFEEKYEEYEDKAKKGEMNQFKSIPAKELWRKMLTMLFETGHPWITFKDSCNLRSPQQHSGVVHSSNLCTEITLNTSADKEIAVCNLGSVNLANHMKGGSLDEEKVKQTVSTAIRMLDNVININYYSVDTAKNSNFKHRPIGLGIQGLADVYFKLGIAYESEEAKEINKLIFETIYFGALEASCELAKEKGAYETFKNSPISEGKFQFDLWNVNPSSKWDWDSLRAKIKEHGVRNSLTTACMPTASTGIILGNTETFQIQTSNIYKRQTLSGEFLLVNRYLVNELSQRGLWNKEMRDKIILENGSVENINEIPTELKEIYKTVWEVSQKTVIDMSADRAPFIDQTQSMNLWLSTPTFGKVNSMHMYAWKKGLKTGMYYLRSRSAVDAVKVTVSSEKAAKDAYINTAIKQNNEPEDCETCSA